MLLAIKDNYSKRMLIKDYISTFGLMLAIGLYELLFLTIFSIPFIFLKTGESKRIIFIDFLDFLKGTKIILSISILICKFAYAIFLLILIDKFSPSYLPFSFLLFLIFNNIYNTIKNFVNHKENAYYIYLNFAFYAILFISAMIHNEIIIISGCGFSKNTKMFLDMKLDEEIRDYLVPVDDEYYTFENQITLKENEIPMKEIVPRN